MLTADNPSVPLQYDEMTWDRRIRQILTVQTDFLSKSELIKETIKFGSEVNTITNS